MRLGILVAAVVLTAGCGGGSGDDPGSTEPGSVTPGPGPTPGPVESTTPIAFSAQQQEGEDVTRAGQAGQGATRAAGLETKLPEGRQSFKVWGYKNMGSNGSTLQNVFPGYTVNYKSSSAHSTTSNTDGWEYVNQGPVEQSIKYWDYNATAYRFFGVAPATATMEENEDQENHLKKITFDADVTSDETIAATPYYSRLWYSTGSMEPGSPYYDKQFGKPVTLEFVKPISKVRFMYKYVSPRAGVIKGSQCFRPTVSSENIIRGGEVTVTYPLTGTEPEPRESTKISRVTDVLSEGFTEDYDPETANKVYTETDNGWYMVLPNTEQGSYMLTVEVNGTSKSAIVPAEFMQWQSGYSYTYIFKINAEGGVEIGWVDYAVTPWTEMEADRTVYNW